MDELRDLYGAEQLSLRLFNKMVKEAHTPALRGVLTAQSLGTEGQIGRLRHVFGLLDQTIGGRESDGVMGLIEDTVATMDQAFDEATMDACLIAGALRIKLHTQAGHRTLLGWARALGWARIVPDLQLCVDQDLGAESRLLMLMESGLLQAAAHPAVLDPDFEDAEDLEDAGGGENEDQAFDDGRGNDEREDGYGEDGSDSPVELDRAPMR